MSRELYLECCSGISGDMTVAALLDLGADREILDKALKSLPVSGFTTRISEVKKSGLSACDFAVLLDDAHENHDHDMQYLYGHEEHHNREGHHSGDLHDYGGDSQNHHHAHEHRGLPEILHIIEQADMSDRAKKLAKRIFELLAAAEAKAHGVPLEEVHFHEVGAVDSIVDVVAAAVCFDNLGITEVVVSELYEGRGVIRCQHGIIPVPVPAVVHIAEANALKLHITEDEGEFVTPTGAAIVAAVKTKDKLPESFTIEKTGLGAGKREHHRAGILRAMIIRDRGKSNMENSYRYFKNDKCKYFPCHAGMQGEDFNCLFCYCPMNSYEDCPGTPAFIELKNGKVIKDCTNCTFPHYPENYDKIIEFLGNKRK